MATKKKISMFPTPQPPAPDPDAWVRTRNAADEEPAPAPKAAAPAVEEVQLKRLTIDMPADLHRELKIHAASQGLQMAELVRRWIREGVDAEQR
jgi:hypothetical protein